MSKHRIKDKGTNGAIILDSNSNSNTKRFDRFGGEIVSSKSSSPSISDTPKPVNTPKIPKTTLVDGLPGSQTAANISYGLGEHEFRSITEPIIKDDNKTKPKPKTNIKSEHESKVESEQLIQWQSVYESWYRAPMLTREQYTYLRMIESIFKVLYPDGQWKHIKLTNHQAEFHAGDIAIMGFNAKNRVVIKSRGTSFTTDSLISLCMAAYTYRDQLSPVVRINDVKVMELLKSDFKSLIDHMTPIEYVHTDPSTGKDVVEYIPFNNKTVEFTAHTIKIPDRNVTFVGYPANSTASENIRGNRINFGLMDETNFILAFQNIDTAMRDATRGVILSGPDKGKVAYQATYGTTRKGKYTSFNLWLENIQRLQAQGHMSNFEVIKWPALDPAQVDLTIPLTEQPHLVPIAPWQTLEKLEERRIENPNIFKEEYMAMLVDEDGALYDMQLISNELLLPDTIKSDMWIPVEQLESMSKANQTKWWIGVDPAYIQDFFSITIYKEVFNIETQQTEFIQTCCDYERGADPEEKLKQCERLIEHYLPYGLEIMHIDGNGPGVHIANVLRKKHPKNVRVYRSTVIKTPGRITGNIPIKEFQHTHQIKLQYERRVKYLADPIQLMHFSGWNLRYNFDKPKDSSMTDMGHGDTTISNALGLLPRDLNYLKHNMGWSVLGKTEKGRQILEKRNYELFDNEKLQERYRMTVDEKTKFYEKQNKKDGGGNRISAM